MKKEVEWALLTTVIVKQFPIICQYWVENLVLPPQPLWEIKNDFYSWRAWIRIGIYWGQHLDNYVQRGVTSQKHTKEKKRTGPVLGAAFPERKEGTAVHKMSIIILIYSFVYPYYIKKCIISLQNSILHYVFPILELYT